MSSLSSLPQQSCSSEQQEIFPAARRERSYKKGLPEGSPLGRSFLRRDDGVGVALNPIKLSPPDVCPSEVSVAKVCAPEVSAAEVSIVEVCSTEAGTPEVGVLKVSASEVCTIEGAAPQVAPQEVRPDEHLPVEGGSPGDRGFLLDLLLEGADSSFSCCHDFILSLHSISCVGATKKGSPKGALGLLALDGDIPRLDEGRHTPRVPGYHLAVACSGLPPRGP
jgi:DNA-binding transcriptional regulator YdaS (Cro superfamily)